MGRLIFITEQTLGNRPLRVDRAANTVYSVKIIGFESQNNRRYTAKALQEAIALYEGVKVNIDHPENPEDSRSVYDRIGKLTNIRFVKNKGLFGDLWLLPSHKLTEEVYDAASLMPDLFGLSHNAQGEGEEDKDGVFVVNRITEVRHVDLVADPATTKSLSESITTKRSRSMREEDEKDKEPLEAEYEDKGTAEEDGGMHEQVMDILSGEGDDMAKAEAIVKLFSGEDTPEGEDEKTEEEDDMKEAEDNEEEDDMEEAEDEEKKDDKKDASESRKIKASHKALQEQFKALKKSLYLRQLFESERLPVDKVLMADLSKLSYPLIKSMVKRLSAAHKASKPRSGIPMQEDRAKGPQIKAGTDLYQWLQN